MSTQDENQLEELSDLDVRFLRDMDEFFAPGGLYDIQRSREEQNQRTLPPLETYEWVNYGKGQPGAVT